MRISVIGSGYVGLVTAVCFAELGHEVTLYDNDPAKQHALQQGLSPIHERYVPELLKRHLGGKLNLSNSLADSVGQSVAIFVAVGTPPTVNGEADLSYVESVAREIAANIKDYKIVVQLHRGTPDGQIRGQLQIKTDDPEQQVLNVPFYGIVGQFSM